MAPAVFKTVGCNLLQRQVRFLPHPHTTMSDNSALRNIPQVEKLLADERFSPYETLLGRDILTSIIRESVDSFRAMLRDNASLSTDDLIADILAACAHAGLERLQRVVNGTGVIIHTNFGRAPLSPDVLERPCPRTFRLLQPGILPPGKEARPPRRLRRAASLRPHRREDALIVNNNAAARLPHPLRVRAGTRGGRLPRRAGADRRRLPHPGHHAPERARAWSRWAPPTSPSSTTIAAAITGDTAMIFSVHQSNFAHEGFTDTPSLRELASLKSGWVLLVRDLGAATSCRPAPAAAIRARRCARSSPRGPTWSASAATSSSAGCQAGIIVGRKDLSRGCGKIRSCACSAWTRSPTIYYRRPC